MEAPTPRGRAATAATSALVGLIQEAASARQLLDEAQAVADERRRSDQREAGSAGGGAQEAVLQAHHTLEALVGAALAHEDGSVTTVSSSSSSSSSAQPQALVLPRSSAQRQRAQLRAATQMLRSALHFALHPPFAASLLLSHHSARHLWTSNPLGSLACTMEWERFKKAFVAYAKEHVAPTSKELDLLYRVLTDTPSGPLLVSSSGSKSPPPVTLVRLALVTDRWGVLGSFLRLTRSEAMPRLGGEVVVIEGVSEKDLLYGEPVRAYLDACGTVYRYRAVKGGMAVEFEEESGVMYHIMGQAKEKGPLAKKKVTAALATSPSIDDLAQSSGKLKTGKKKDTKITSALIEEFLLQHKLLEDEVAALEKRTTGLDSGQEAEWCLAEIERKRDEMAFALRVLDILSPPSVSSGGSAIITSRDAKSKDKKARTPPLCSKKMSLSEAKAKRLTVDLSSLRKNSYRINPGATRSADPIPSPRSGGDTKTSSPPPSPSSLPDSKLSFVLPSAGTASASSPHRLQQMFDPPPLIVRVTDDAALMPPPIVRVTSPSPAARSTLTDDAALMPPPIVRVTSPSPTATSESRATLADDATALMPPPPVPSRLAASDQTFTPIPSPRPSEASGGRASPAPTETHNVPSISSGIAPLCGVGMETVPTTAQHITGLIKTLGGVTSVEPAAPARTSAQHREASRQRRSALADEIGHVFDRVKALESSFAEKEEELWALEERLESERVTLEQRATASARMEQELQAAAALFEQRRQVVDEKDASLAERERRVADVQRRNEEAQRDINRRESDCARLQSDQEEESNRLREEKEVLRKDRQRQMAFLLQAEQDLEARDNEGQMLLKQRQALVRQKEEELQRRQQQLLEREQELERSGGGGGSAGNALRKVAELDEALKRAHEVISRLEREALDKDQEVDRLSRALASAMAEAAKPVVGKLSVCAMCKESISHSFAESADPDGDASTIAFPMVKGRFPAPPRVAHVTPSKPVPAEVAVPMDFSLPPPPVFHPRSPTHPSSPILAALMPSSLPPPLPLPPPLAGPISWFPSPRSLPPPVDDISANFAAFATPSSFLPTDLPSPIGTPLPPGGAATWAPADLPPPPLPSPFCSPRPFEAIGGVDGSDELFLDPQRVGEASPLPATPPPPPPPPLLFIPSALSLTLTLATLERLSALPDASVRRMQQVVRGWLFRRRARRLTCWIASTPETDIIRTRNRAFRELVDTERSYVQCLQDCKDAFLTPLYSSAAAARSLGDDSFITEEQLKEIFGDFELIVQVNLKFLLELEECAREWHNKPHSGPILHAWARSLMPVMKLYAGYVKNYEQTEAALRKHEKRTRFAALIKECKAMPSNRRKLPLSAYLIMPIQRVARYRLLALEILRHTPDEHLDRGQMEAAVEQLQALCATINDSKRDADSRKMSLHLIAHRITGAPASLASPSRVFIMEGPLSVMETRTKEFHCFLFNDLFVRTKQKKKRSNCVWKGEVPLGNVTLIDLDDTAARRNAFQRPASDDRRLRAHGGRKERLDARHLAASFVFFFNAKRALRVVACRLHHLVRFLHTS